MTEVYTGETLQFSAEVLPGDATNKDITWSVENQTGEATIDQSGLLTATLAGTVNVVATAQDGSGVTGSMQITITDQIIPVTQINVSSAGGVTEIYTGETLQFSAEVLPGDATNKDITWSVENQTGEATIDQSGLLTATLAGTVNVVATAQDGSGVTGIQSIQLLDQMTLPEEKDTLIIKVYPNPGSGYLFLDAGDVDIELIQVVYNNGRKAMDVIPAKEIPVIPIDLSNLSSGNYIIKVYSKNMVAGKRIIIQ
mgnify:CR=1 FL=1